MSIGDGQHPKTSSGPRRLTIEATIQLFTPAVRKQGADREAQAVFAAERPQARRRPFRSGYSVIIMRDATFGGHIESLCT